MTNEKAKDLLDNIIDYDTALEKIRAEIERLENVCSKEHGCIAEVLQVIDKYTKQTKGKPNE